jgi:O-antigen/teichoic acid export membrane protein
MSGTQRNFFALAGGEVTSRAVGFLATALLARRLGADEFGVLGLAFAVTSYFMVPGIGLQDLAAREVAKHPADAARLASSITRVRLLSAVGLVLLAGLIAAVLPKPPLVRSVVALSALVLIPTAGNVGWMYKALERPNAVSASLLFGQLVLLGGIVAFVHGSQDVLRVPVLQTVSEVAAALLLASAMRGGWKDGSIREGIVALRGATAALVARYLRALTVTADVVLLSFLGTDREVGLYTAAYRICFMLTAIAASAHVVFLPAQTRSRSDAVEGGAVLGRALGLAWLAGAPLVIGGILVAPDLLAFVFGEQYRSAGPALQLLLASTGLLFVHGVMRNVLLVQNRLRTDARINAVAAFGNIGANLFVIPKYGPAGAALVMVATDAAILIGNVAAIRWAGWRVSLRPFLAPTLAASAMAAVLYVLPHSLHVTVQVACGGAVYVLCLALSGNLSRWRAALLPTA